MSHPYARSFRRKKKFIIRTFMIFFLGCITYKWKFGFSTNLLSLKTLHLDGNFEFDEVHQASRDFGNRFHYLPLGVLNPKSVSDISSTIRHIWEMGPNSELTVAARGNGHSLQGQAQAHHGVVINMQSLKGMKMQVHTSDLPYIDVSGGELWINVLRESLQYGLTPKSWTDYLHLTVGGTLSNAGISGQAFRHGPQISNVQQLEVVTGKGEVINCSEKQNGDLFQAVLGGLGQFGIITQARISLEPAPSMVKWIRVLYLEFAAFTRDQERLISTDNPFDYIEGFVVVNRTGLLNNWRLSFTPRDPVQANLFKSDDRILYCLELAKYFNLDEKDAIIQEVNESLSELSYISSTLFQSEISYEKFLNRVHLSEITPRYKGLRDVPHPWLNLFVPRSKIHIFAQAVFGNILTDTSNRPILIYPVNTSKWDNRTAAVLPDEDVFYIVAFLFSAVPSSTGKDGLEHILNQNKRILDFCETARLGVKQYLPHYTTNEEWRAHFGPQWEAFARRKQTYDPLRILAPGQRIFQKEAPYS